MSSSTFEEIAATQLVDCDFGTALLEESFPHLQPESKLGSLVVAVTREASIARHELEAARAAEAPTRTVIELAQALQLPRRRELACNIFYRDMQKRLECGFAYRGAVGQIRSQQLRIINRYSWSYSQPTKRNLSKLTKSIGRLYLREFGSHFVELA
jgi:hypothetical protein